MKVIIERWKAQSPQFFVKLRNLSLAIAASSSAAIVAYSALPTDLQSLIPLWLMKYTAVGSVVSAIVSQLTKK